MEKKQSMTKDLSSQGAHGLDFGKGVVENNSRTEAVSMEGEPASGFVTNFDILHGNEFSDIGGNSVDLNNSMGNLVGQPTYIIPMQKALSMEGGVGLRLCLFHVSDFPENTYFPEMLFSGKENIFKCLVALRKML